MENRDGTEKSYKYNIEANKDRETEIRNKMRKKRNEQRIREQLRSQQKSMCTHDMGTLEVDSEYKFSEYRIEAIYVIKTEPYYENHGSIKITNPISNKNKCDSVVIWHLILPKNNNSLKKFVAHIYKFNNLYDQIFKHARAFNQEPKNGIKEKMDHFNICVKRNFQHLKNNEEDLIGEEGILELDYASIFKCDFKNLTFKIFSILQYRGTNHAGKKNTNWFNKPIEERLPIVHYPNISKNKILNARHDKQNAFGDMIICKDVKLPMLAPLYAFKVYKNEGNNENE